MCYCLEVEWDLYLIIDTVPYDLLQLQHSTVTTGTSDHETLACPPWQLGSTSQLFIRGSSARRSLPAMTLLHALKDTRGNATCPPRNLNTQLQFKDATVSGLWGVLESRGQALRCGGKEAIIKLSVEEWLGQREFVAITWKHFFFK